MPISLLPYGSNVIRLTNDFKYFKATCYVHVRHLVDYGFATKVFHQNYDQTNEDLYLYIMKKSEQGNFLQLAIESELLIAFDLY